MKKALWEVARLIIIWPVIFVLARTHPISISFYLACFLTD